MHRALVAVCVKANLVSAEAAATLEPTLTVYWSDARVDQKLPLPMESTEAGK